MSSPQSESAGSPHLTAKQLAARWQTTPNAIYIARHRGKAPQGFKRGTGLLFPITAVEAFEAAQLSDDRPSNRRAATQLRPPEPLSARRPRRPSKV
ncbi:DNA-binding protein [Streptomyces sp. SID8352]|uniref:DNA-binding protein n=1 Tax=Streptomyces sp. SID8352 TaxID=2690338 RepID=UPI00136DA9A8|nr:DNA-binding protein [Streptomyces sp. SID8352]MYU24518.1 DNA-binding protein [Streptomyces sp. SID8352]